MNRKFLILVAVGAISAATACTKPRGLEPIVFENKIPGTVNESWEEPMPDVVKVPGQLDPTGTYYLREHNAVVEVRPERYDELRYDDEKKN